MMFCIIVTSPILSLSLSIVSLSFYRRLGKGVGGWVRGVGTAIGAVDTTDEKLVILIIMIHIIVFVFVCYYFDLLFI